MCFSTIKIRNKKYDSDDITQPKFHEFPCRKCAECIDIISSEYAFRAQMETQRCKASGGFVYFNTFTYNDKYLPILYYNDGSKISTWNKQHIQKFLKKLRKFFYTYYGIEKYCFRYLITSERGSSKTYRVVKFGIPQFRQATSRPHYHSEFWFYNASKTALKDLPDWCDGHTDIDLVFPIAFRHFWGESEYVTDPLNPKKKNLVFHSYGNVDEVKLTRSDALATKYIAKYICKQFRDNVLDRLDEISYHNHDIPFKDFRPFTLISHGLGSNYIPSFDELTGKKKVELLASLGHVVDINLPQYYIRKYCKDITFDGFSSVQVKKEDWTPIDGFVPSHVNYFHDVLFDDGLLVSKIKLSKDVYAVTSPPSRHYVSSDNELGKLVHDSRFSMKVEKFIDDLKSFIGCPEKFYKLARVYNPIIHESYSNVARRFLNFDKYKSDCYKSLKFAGNILSNTSLVTIIDAVPTYFHEGVDLNDNLSYSLDICYRFFVDCRNLKNALKRYLNNKRFRQNLSKMMQDNPELFIPVDVDDFKFDF